MREEIAKIQEKEENAKEGGGLSESEDVGDLDLLQENSVLLRGARARTPSLDLFDDKITELENKRREIK